MVSDERLNGANCQVVDISNDDIGRREKLPDSLEGIAGVIITGSPANINQKEQKRWIKETEDFVLKALEKKIPVFGICFDLQLVKDAQGKEVVTNESGPLSDCTKVGIFLRKDQGELKKHPIFEGLPFQEDSQGNRSLVMPVVVYHGYSYKSEIGKAVKDRLTISGFEFPDKQMVAYPGLIVDGDFVGVQFHPERMAEIGYWCRYTVILTLGKDIFDNLKISTEEKLEKLSA